MIVELKGLLKHISNVLHLMQYSWWAVNKNTFKERGRGLKVEPEQYCVQIYTFLGRIYIKSMEGITYPSNYSF